jgi:RNA polymerase sigma factor (sigma-70 family)
MRILRSDAELWSAILADDQLAWKELVDRYKALVYGTCTFTGLSQSDAADIFQQTWMLLYKNRGRLIDPARVSAWLVTTARRESIRLRNRRKGSAEQEITSDLADSSPDPEEELILRERQAKLEVAIQALDPVCRELVRAFFFSPEEKTYEQIARSLGYAPNTLGAKRRRCLEKLKRILEQLGYLSERK